MKLFILSEGPSEYIKSPISGKKVFMPTLWYENEKGDKIVPDMTKPGPPPKGYKYQHSQFPTELVHNIFRIKKNGSEEVATGHSGYQEDLVLGLVDMGYSLSEAILLAANCCERCMNVMAHKCGLDWGYEEGSEEYNKCDTECDLCKSV